MQKYQIIVAYDGTNYHGWQLQPKLPSIISVLQNSFQTIFGSPIKMIGASRTDAGVHAHGQVAMFMTDLIIDTERMLFAWNNRLPADIVIRSINITHPRFHPFYNVERKVYHYHIFTEQPSPFLQRFGTYYQKKIDISLLHKALHLFIGTHDFTSFCAADSQSPSKVRTITDISIEYIPEWNAYRIIITGNSFLRYMIRRIVGAAIKVATTPAITVEYIQHVLHAKNPNHALPTAPAKGLTLHEVIYKQEPINE
jgi:tRNA pseudouridine38-40 synthase